MTPENAADWLAIIADLGAPATAILAAGAYVLALHRGWLVTGARHQAEVERANYWREREAAINRRALDAEARIAAIAAGEHSAKRI